MKPLPATHSGQWWAVAASAVLLFALFFPTHFLIADEWRYFEQARAWASGHTRMPVCPPCPGPCAAALPGEYPPGTSLLAAFFIWTGGIRAVFWQSLLCWLAGLWAIARTLRQHGAPVFWTAYPALFLPALVLTRTLMSDMPSFLLAALFLWALSCRKSRAGLFLAGSIGGLGILFRETNVLWALPFLVAALVRKLPHRGYLWGGFFAGLLPRALAGAWLFDDPLFIKDPGYSFAFAAVPANLLYYGFALLVLLPGGLWRWWKSNHPFRLETGVCIGLFLLVYSGYDYPAFARSGYKGAILQGRFLLPLLPFLTLCAASPAIGQSRRLKTAMLGAAGFLFAGIQAAGWLYNREQKKLTDALYRQPAPTQLSYSPDESVKYTNALYGPVNIANGLVLFSGDLKCRPVWYVHLLGRSESAERLQKNRMAEQMLFEHFEEWETTLLHDQQIADGTRLRIWRFQLNGNHEQGR